MPRALFAVNVSFQLAHCVCPPESSLAIMIDGHTYARRVWPSAFLESLTLIAMVEHFALTLLRRCGARGDMVANALEKRAFFAAGRSEFNQGLQELMEERI